MTLEDYQELLLQQLDCFGERDYAIQFHDDLSPAGWHLGHCVYTETYWIREQLLMTQAVENPLKELFVPERSLKKERGNKIASFRELRDWSERMQAENRRLIAEYNGQAADHELIQDDFMFQFLKQHYAQHFETLQMVRAQRMLREDQEYRPGNPLESRRQTDTFIYLNGADVRIGSGVSWHYDNEKPVFTCQPGPFEISRLPVNNAAYLYFMEDGGYGRAEFWCEEGWRWRTARGITRPEYWRENGSGWYQVTPSGPQVLQADTAVQGLSWYEASAYARWAGARLPHEYEWEIACREGKLEDTGQSWEWCTNTFHPYPGFRAFPYEGYSVPYFDDRHYTLRGGSNHTLEIIRRPTFRNYYQADKRYIFAGLRLARDVARN